MSDGIKQHYVQVQGDEYPQMVMMVRYDDHDARVAVLKGLVNRMLVHCIAANNMTMHTVPELVRVIAEAEEALK